MKPYAQDNDKALVLPLRWIKKKTVDLLWSKTSHPFPSPASLQWLYIPKQIDGARQSAEEKKTPTPCLDLQYGHNNCLGFYSRRL